MGVLSTSVFDVDELYVVECEIVDGEWAPVGIYYAGLDGESILQLSIMATREGAEKVMQIYLDDDPNSNLRIRLYRPVEGEL